MEKINYRKIGMNVLMKTIGGKLRYQKLFEYLFLIACHGKNIGGLNSVEDSGEGLVLENIKNEKLGKEICIFDVGANCGDYSILALDIFEGEKLNLYSFEPSKFTFNILRKNLIKKNVNLFNIGFGDKKETRDLFNTKEGLGLASLYKRNLKEYGMEMNLVEKVDIETLDSFCEKNNIKKIDLLKIDVEGHEFNILKGAKRIIKSGLVEKIQFEFGCNYDSRTYFKDFFYLLIKDYKIYRVLRDGLYPIEEYKWTNEIFNAINYLAIKRK